MKNNGFSRKFCVAPILGATDRFFRHYARVLSKNALLYTEMVNVKAVLEGNYAPLLKDNAKDQPVSLQLSGYCPQSMAKTAVFAENAGFCEININSGCPSYKGVEGRFGACLMLEPETVASCVKAIKDSVNLPVTVKCRLGVGDDYPFSRLVDYIGTVKDKGCQTFIVHARKANIDTFSTRQNLKLPSLCYEDVYRLKELFPDLEIIINGSIITIDQALEHMKKVDGVMLGRAVYHDLFMMAKVDSLFYHSGEPQVTYKQAWDKIIPYFEEELSKGARFSHMIRGLLGFYKALPYAKEWRRFFSKNAFVSGSGFEVLINAVKMMEEYENNSLSEGNISNGQ